MNRMKDRAKNPSHKQMLEKGYSLEHPKGKQPKNYITALQWGSNGRRYWKVMKMSVMEKKLSDSYDRRVKAGKEVYFTYKPNSLLMEFMFKYHLDVKKDKLGNVTVTVSKAKVNKASSRRRKK